MSFRGENKALFKKCKAQLQRRFRRAFGRMPFVPLPTGGNTNTGTLVKEAFSKPALFARVLGMPELEFIIEGIDTLLVAVNSKGIIQIK